MTDSAAEDHREVEQPARRHGLRQAAIPPVVADGVLPFRIGLAAFALAALLSLLPQSPDWLRPISLVGVLIGSIGLIYCTQRRDKNSQRRD